MHRSAALAEWQILAIQVAPLEARGASCGERFALDRQHPGSPYAMLTDTVAPTRPGIHRRIFTMLSVIPMPMIVGAAATLRVGTKVRRSVAAGAARLGEGRLRHEVGRAS